MRHKNRMKGIFDKVYGPNDDYEERLARDFRKVANGTRAVARLMILGSLIFIVACSLILAACIKYLFVE